MRVLIVGFAASVHMARYLQLFDGTEWDVHLFDSVARSIPHPELPEVTLHSTTPELPPKSRVRLVRPSRSFETFDDHVAHLGSVIEDVRPQLVHTHEIQHAALLVDELRLRTGSVGAPWLVTNWGSDIYRFGRSEVHRQRIRSVVSGCDYYGAECHRDVALARAFGLQGEVIGVWPIAGGIDIPHAAELRTPGPTSTRRTISMKGDVSPIVCGDVAFAAVQECEDLLTGWELCTYQMHAELDREARAFAREAGLRYRRLSATTARDAPHDDLLAMHGRSRVSLALNRSDAISTSFLEAMAMGSFPVHSFTSCGDELAVDGRGALFVPPDDAHAVATALRHALTDDTLVDGARGPNLAAIEEHANRARVRMLVLDAYERIATDAAVRTG